MSKIKVIDDKRQIVAEGPVWDEKNEILYTIDILGQTVRTTNLDTLEHTEVKYPQQIGCIVLRPDGGLVGALQDGIYDMCPDGTIIPVCIPEKLKGRRFNDGKVGPDGRLYVGTTDADHLGALYRVEADGTITEILDHLGCSNGIAWSPDRHTMYLVDSPDRKIYAFDFNPEEGSISNRRTLINAPGDQGEPDGMTIDEDGKLWLAMWGGKAFYHIDPEKAEILEKFEMPAKIVSCCEFAGKNRDKLIITTASKGISPEEEPDAGKTFALDTTVHGGATWRFGMKM